MIGIYKITNKITNKVYIGQSTNIKRRWREHRRMLYKGIHHSFKLQESYNKYGKDNFEFSVIQTCNEDNLCELENLYIKQYNAIYDGYNMDKTMIKISDLRFDDSREKIVNFFKKLNGNNFHFYIDNFNIYEYI